MAKIIIIEPFYGGSHKQLLDTVLESMEQSIIYFIVTKIYIYCILYIFIFIVLKMSTAVNMNYLHCRQKNGIGALGQALYIFLSVYQLHQIDIRF